MANPVMHWQILTKQPQKARGILFGALWLEGFG